MCSVWERSGFAELDRLQWIKIGLSYWISWISQNHFVFLGIILSDIMKALAITREHVACLWWC